MLRFCGFDLELTVESVLQRRLDDPAVCTATDPSGQRWLIVEVPGDGDDLSWYCAPASARAVEQVVSGRAAARDAVLHSQTGWVEVVSVVAGRTVPDRRLPCSELTAQVAANAPGWRAAG